MSAPRITLLSRPGCHLCDDARDVIRRVAEDLGVAWEERDITRSEDDMREYWEKIPVTLVDGIQHDFWRVSEDRLRAALSRDSTTAPRLQTLNRQGLAPFRAAWSRLRAPEPMKPRTAQTQTLQVPRGAFGRRRPARACVVNNPPCHRLPGTGEREVTLRD